MKFADLAIGNKFTLNNKLYQRVETDRINCCTIRKNCILLEDNSDVVLANDTQVELYVEESTD